MLKCEFCDKELIGRQKRACSNLCKNRIKSIDYQTKFKGEGNPFYGKHHSNKTKKVLRKMAGLRTGEIAANYKDGRCKNFKKYHDEYNKYYIRKKEYIYPSSRYFKRRTAYYKKNKAKLLMRTRKWREENREHYKALRHKRRIAESDLTTRTVQLVYEDNIKTYGTLTCYLCRKPIVFGKDSLEHKTPLSRGGTNKYCNLAIACRSCNCRKHAKTEEEYKKEILQCR